jgi:hypothetical protein
VGKVQFMEQHNIVIKNESTMQKIVIFHFFCYFECLFPELLILKLFASKHNNLFMYPSNVLVIFLKTAYLG